MIIETCYLKILFINSNFFYSIILNTILYKLFSNSFASFYKRKNISKRLFSISINEITLFKSISALMRCSTPVKVCETYSFICLILVSQRKDDLHEQNPPKYLVILSIIEMFLLELHIFHVIYFLNCNSSIFLKIR